MILPSYKALIFNKLNVFFGKCVLMRKSLIWGTVLNLTKSLPHATNSKSNPREWAFPMAKTPQRKANFTLSTYFILHTLASFSLFTVNMPGEVKIKIKYRINSLKMSYPRLPNVLCLPQPLPTTRSRTLLKNHLVREACPGLSIMQYLHHRAHLCKFPW